MHRRRGQLDARRAGRTAATAPEPSAAGRWWCPVRHIDGCNRLHRHLEALAAAANEHEAPGVVTLRLPVVGRQFVHLAGEHRLQVGQRRQLTRVERLTVLRLHDEPAGRYRTSHGSKR